MEYKTSPLKAIKEKCIDCCCGQKYEVKLCPAESCPVWPFRLGKNPFLKGRTMTPEQREAAAERLRYAREAISDNE